MATTPSVSTPRADAGDHHLPKLHVLLADDQIINVMIVSKLLALLGCTVERVENGLQAVERWQQDRFDLILMDVQMPEMNGFEATARIRELEHPGSAHVPIVALTANALPQDRQKCLAAGMDAYLAKPITTDTLAQAMRDALRHAAQERSHATGPEPVQQQAADLDWARLLASLGGDEALLLEFVQAMQTELRRRMDQLHDTARRTDPALACAQAHALRGALGGVGAETAVALTRALESSAKAEEWDAFRQTLAQLKAEVQGIESALAAVS